MGPGCWLLVHKMRNILEKVRRRDYDAAKTDAQKSATTTLPFNSAQVG